ncbi:hypothetical protein [Spirosoma rhododendri]|uniref:Uncharacterized protein n=1 Tax=Spirosoma rhododendri TaxID=2728024 RepID=A0A7L5DPL6_9BACT|nr:hypothetical protein [Spirosoma rhododendri]QJD79532.1 hypothetical protein HH216_14770 [Spirosoma rhododendri]
MPKETTKAASTKGIVGLLATDSMLIRFAGRDYDLANLSADDEAYLRQFPDQVPYLQKPLDVSNPAND